jgi:ABC-2 type transport system permease protein
MKRHEHAGRMNRSGGPAPAPGRQTVRRDTFREKWLRVLHLMRKEFLQIVRNRQNFRILLIAPVFQLVLFGYAVRLDVDHVRTVVADLNRSALSRELIGSFSRSHYFDIIAHEASYDEVNRYLDSGEATMAILIPPDLDRLVKGDLTARVGILIDGVDTTTASTVSGYAQAIVQNFSLDRMEPRLMRARGLRHTFDSPIFILPRVRAEARAWFNADLDSKNYFVPGILGLILTFFTLTLTAMALVREKERGTMEQLMVTPISSFELILGKTIPCFFIGSINLVTMTILACLWFQPPFRGPAELFAVASVIHMLTCLGMGMLISVFCRTQQQAILSSFMVLQPSVILSGFVFPIDNMPEIIQVITYINPLRYFLIVVREVFLKGIGWEILWPQLVPLIIMAVGYIALASALFRKKID